MYWQLFGHWQFAVEASGHCQSHPSPSMHAPTYRSPRASSGSCSLVYAPDEAPVVLTTVA